MHARHPGGSSRMEPLVFDGNLHPRLATVTVANNETKPENGYNPAHPVYPRRDRTAMERAAQPGRPPFPARNQSGCPRPSLAANHGAVHPNPSLSPTPTTP